MKAMLFTDGSANAALKIGYGAYLFVSQSDLASTSLGARVATKRFENVSCARLELETLLWALSESQTPKRGLTIYTDSQNIMRLPMRRAKLEESDCRSKQGTPLSNRDLYQSFYEAIDRIQCDFVKVSGHLRSNRKTDIDRLFALVDRAARGALRADIAGLSAGHSRTTA